MKIVYKRFRQREEQRRRQEESRDQRLEMPIGCVSLRGALFDAQLSSVVNFLMLMIYHGKQALGNQLPFLTIPQSKVAIKIIGRFNGQFNLDMMAKFMRRHLIHLLKDKMDLDKPETTYHAIIHDWKKPNQLMIQAAALFGFSINYLIPILPLRFVIHWKAFRITYRDLSILAEHPIFGITKSGAMMMADGSMMSHKDFVLSPVRELGPVQQLAIMERELFKWSVDDDKPLVPFKPVSTANAHCQVCKLQALKIGVESPPAVPPRDLQYTAVDFRHQLSTYFKNLA